MRTAPSSSSQRYGRPVLPRAKGGSNLNVLMAYATKHGSSRQVAEAITEVMQERGAQVTLHPARAVRESAARFDMVVLGAPLYSGRWHRDAHRFLRRHRGELSGLPVAVFGMGPRSDTEEAWQRSRSQLDKALAKRGWLNPVTVTVFGGVDPPGSSKHTHRDLRNWDTIAAWAAQVLAIAGATRRDGRTPGRCSTGITSTSADTHGAAAASAGAGDEAFTVEHGRGDPPPQPVQENQHHRGRDGEAR